MANHKKIEGPWKYFSDCSICQAMKDGRADTMEGLKRAFDEANAQQRGNSLSLDKKGNEISL